MGTKRGKSGNSVNVNYNPIPPEIDWQEMKKQLRLDVFDKEVQSASTYSYMWIAIQVGHICLGMIIFFLLYLLQYSMFGKNNYEIIRLLSLAEVFSAFAFWEWRAYLDAAKRATPLFPLNSMGLKNNAVIATVYMWIGSLVGLSFLWGVAGNYLFGFLLFFLLLLCSLAPAPYWLKQKIIWQKAGFPYLFRLANTPLIIDTETAKIVQEKFVAQSAPPHGNPQIVIIYGPVDIGRTQLAVGIGCELAFRNKKVRYLTFDKLMELIAHNTDFLGLRNINYWDWRESQVLIIDDINSFFDPMEGKHLNLFANIVEAHRQEVTGQEGDEVDFAGEKKYNPLGNRHTVWVLGVEDPVPWKEKIMQFCQCVTEPIMVQVAENRFQ